MSAQANSERQAAHRAKKQALLEEISVELAKTASENRDFREKITELEGKIKKQADMYEKKISNLEKKLIKALEASNNNQK
jgi:hypothetical protein